MVLFFKSTAVDPPVVVYMGKDKFESECRVSACGPAYGLADLCFALHCTCSPAPTTDEDLIKYGFEEDVWFHVDKVGTVVARVDCLADLLLNMKPLTPPPSLPHPHPRPPALRSSPRHTCISACRRA